MKIAEGFFYIVELIIILGFCWLWASSTPDQKELMNRSQDTLIITKDFDTILVKKSVYNHK